MATNPGCTGSGIGMVVVAGKPAPLFKRKKELEGVITNPERRGIGMGMGIRYGKLPPPKEQIKEKKQDGEATNPERTGIRIGMGIRGRKPAPSIPLPQSRLKKSCGRRGAG